MSKFAVFLLVIALVAAGYSLQQVHELRAQNAIQRSQVDAQIATSAAASVEVDAALKSQAMRLKSQAELMGELEQAQFAAKDARAELVNGLRSEIARLAGRQEQVEAFWAEKGELFEPIPIAKLEAGYSFSWEGDASLPLQPVGTVITLPDGQGLQFSGGAHIRSSGPAATLVAALMESNELSLVVDFKAGNLAQDGPSRIVSNSDGTVYRNFTLGQDGDALVMRLRTSEDLSGLAPTLTAPGAITGERQVAIFVRSGEQNTFFVDGEQVATLTVAGDFSNWSRSFPLLLANEATADRQWDGEIYKVTFFSRALRESEVGTLSAR